MIIVCINGHPAVGKDTFVQLCQEYIGSEKCLNVSTVDRVKEIARYAGWDGSKTLKNRLFLSDLKSLLIDWCDLPYNDVCSKINEFKANLRMGENAFVFIHVREPIEIDKFVNRIGAKTLKIVRADDGIYSNKSDAEVDNYNYDYEIENNGTIDQLREKAVKFIDSFIV